MQADALGFETVTIVALTMVCVGVIKTFLEVWVPPDNRLHDSAVQLLALLIGIGWSFAFVWVVPVGRGAALQAITSVILGLTGGSASIGTYHVMTAVKRGPAATTPTQASRTIVAPAEARVQVTVPPAAPPGVPALAARAVPVPPSAPTPPPSPEPEPTITTGAQGAPPE